MEVCKEDSRASIEQQFLAQAHASGITVLIGLMNKTELHGIIRDIGRYEINVEENGRITTILKQEISCLSVSHPLVTVASVPDGRHVIDDPTLTRKPNIQQEFLDKAIRENQQLTFFLINSQRIKATIDAYDSFTILLKEGGKQHLYYKHSITTINR